MRLLPVLVAVASTCGLAGAPWAAAEVNPGVTVSLPLNSPLGSVLRAEARNGDPERPYAARVHAYLEVGGTRIADLGEADAPASPRATTVAFIVPAAARGRARRAAARTGHRRAAITFVIHERDPDNTYVPPPFAMTSFVRLYATGHAHGPTRLALAGLGVTGAGLATLDGDVFVAAPRRWPRTSLPGAGTATFGPVVVTADCRAVVVVRTYALAARRPLQDAGRVPVDDPPRASAVGGGPYLGDPSVEAIGLQRFARHRYAGVRIYVDFAPGCPTAAADAQTVLRPLRRIVRGVHAEVRHVRKPAAPSL